MIVRCVQLRFCDDVLTAEVYGDSREEEEEQEGGEDAASAAVLAAEFPREADVAVGRQDRAWRSGTAESSGAYGAHRNLQSHTGTSE